MIRYDPDADALHIRIREGKVLESGEVEDRMIMDNDEKGNVVGIEVLEFSKRKIDLNELVVKGSRILVET